MAGRQAAPSDAVAVANAWIDAYLATLPAEQRVALQSLRETISAAAPEAVEAISYGLPAFRYRGRPLVWYLAAKAHCSLFPTAAVIDAHRAELAGFDLAKGTIRFTPDHPLPMDLVARLVRDRMAQINAAAARKR
jgi:uncharacterized protein YdhG (YjbR/CyaY superfamily)